MATVSVTQAAKLAGISRSTLYRKYINTGQISVQSDRDGKKQIDTSELLRVFGTLTQLPDTSCDTPNTVSHEQPETPVRHTLTQHTPQEIELLRQQLREAKEREQEYRDREAFYQQQIQELTGTLKLLEHKPAPARPNRHWWQFMWK